tara:strand:+ start:16908 stop:17219 length:312 start_codon:yes stop_codon:yes gene_type:complete
MADPRNASTQRAYLSYSQLEELTDWAPLLLDDYQAIQQDFNYTADELDIVDAKIIDLQDSHYPNLSSQVQFIQQQLDGLPKFTCDTTGFTADSTEWTADKDTA